MKAILLKEGCRLEIDNVKTVVSNGLYTLVEINFTLNAFLLTIMKPTLSPFNYRVIKVSKESIEIEFECGNCGVYE